MNKRLAKRIRRISEQCIGIAGGKSPHYEEDGVIFDFVAKGEVVTRSTDIRYLPEFGIYTVRTYLLTAPLEEGDAGKAAIIYAINGINDNAHLELDESGEVFAEYYFLEEEGTRFFGPDFVHFLKFVSICEDLLNGDYLAA